ncbi:hypothetical protein [Thermaerobacillus caldiproteolyticus]|uniref:hypothetical protein n=1 Tax=Thermaerobacillus caldiproteolyticus TaxID=247480 RepID=UPI0018F2266C|nr:hypothetical protein [Anoxybacillus caldiproteolyticus]
MHKTLPEKFDALDVMFEMILSKPVLYLIEKVKNGFNSKSYVLKYFYIDEEIKDKSLQEINNLLQSEEFQNNLGIAAKKLELINKKYQFEKFVEFGTIDCYLTRDKIIVDVKTKKHSRKFEFTEDNYLVDLLNFLESEISDEATELSIGDK